VSRGARRGRPPARLAAWLTLTPELAHQVGGRPADTARSEKETRAYLGAIVRF
jgi:hypothetical protein